MEEDEERGKGNDDRSDPMRTFDGIPRRRPPK
jgi:hypothetical protein